MPQTIFVGEGLPTALSKSPADITVDASGNQVSIKSNLSAVVDPTGTDNFAAGYAVGSRWINTADQKSWVCVGDGVWAETDAAPAGAGTELQYKSGSNFGAVTGSSVSGGNVTLGGDVHVTSGYITRSTATKTNADSPYTVVGADYALFCDATSGSITINLPAASSSTGRTLVIKKTDGSVNSVIIDGSGAETIDGAATATITTQYESITIVCDGTEWWII